MPDYIISVQNNSPIFRLYQRLKADGVKDADLDTGYPETNYVNKTRKIIHQGDHKIDETEVLNYALENYERYQLAIKETVGHDVPWSLDDLDLATDFDEKIRDKVDRAITAFKQVLAAKGLKDGTSQYNELLALALYAFTLTCQPRNIGGRQAVEIPDVLARELVKEKLIGIADYLVENGGLIFTPDQKECELEATALEALAKGCGWCTEQSKILYALMNKAGLNARTLFVLPGARSNRRAKVPASFYHMSVSVRLGNKTRIFDPAMKLSNAEPFYKKDKFVWWFEQDGREMLAGHYNDLGADLMGMERMDSALEQYKTALAVNDNCVQAHYNMGIVLAKKGEPDRAIDEYQAALKLDPGQANSHYQLGNIYQENDDLDRALEELKAAVRFDPEDAVAHNSLGVVLARMGKLDQAIAVFKLATKMEPGLAGSYVNLTSALTLKGVDLEELGENKKAGEAYRQAGAALKKARQRQGDAPQNVIELLEYKLGKR